MSDAIPDDVWRDYCRRHWERAREPRESDMPKKARSPEEKLMRQAAEQMLEALQAVQAAAVALPVEVRFKVQAAIAAATGEQPAPPPVLPVPATGPENDD